MIKGIKGKFRLATAAALWLSLAGSAVAQFVTPVETQQPTAQVRCLLETLDYLSAPLSAAEKLRLEQAASDLAQTNREVQAVLDQHALHFVPLNPESRKD